MLLFCIDYARYQRNLHVSKGSALGVELRDTYLEEDSLLGVAILGTGDEHVGRIWAEQNGPEEIYKAIKTYLAIVAMPSFQHSEDAAELGKKEGEHAAARASSPRGSSFSAESGIISPATCREGHRHEITPTNGCAWGSAFAQY